MTGGVFLITKQGFGGSFLSILLKLFLQVKTDTNSVAVKNTKFGHDCLSDTKRNV